MADRVVRREEIESLSEAERRLFEHYQATVEYPAGVSDVRAVAYNLTRAVRNAGSVVAQLLGDPGPVLSKFAEGKTLREVSAELGAPAWAVGDFMLRYAPAEYRAIMAGQAAVALEAAEGKLADDGATPDNASVSRAANQARMAQWRLERMVPAMYADQSKGGSGGVVVNVVVNREGVVSGRVVSGEEG